MPSALRDCPPRPAPAEDARRASCAAGGASRSRRGEHAAPPARRDHSRRRQGSRAVVRGASSGTGLVFRIPTGLGESFPFPTSLGVSPHRPQSDCRLRRPSCPASHAMVRGLSRAQLFHQNPLGRFRARLSWSFTSGVWALRFSHEFEFISCIHFILNKQYSRLKLSGYECCFLLLIFTCVTELARFSSRVCQCGRACVDP